MKHITYTFVMLFCITRCVASDSTIAKSDTSTQPHSEMIRQVKSSAVFQDEIADNHLHITSEIANSESLPNTQFRGHFKNQKLNGTWNSWYESGIICDSGSFKNNIPDGAWKVWYANGNLRYVRTYNAFRYSMIINEFARKDGKQIIYPLTTLAKQDMTAAYNQLTSYCSFNIPGSPSQRIFLPALVQQNISTSSYTPPFFSCLQHGLYMNYFEDGTVQDSGYYNNGMRNGVWLLTVEENGRRIKTTGNYDNGVKTREWKWYDANGSLVRLSIYNKRGKLMFEKNYAETH
jgi:antitoxin component YwqK of YwqJK toxin-antitoxin module